MTFKKKKKKKKKKGGSYVVTYDSDACWYLLMTIRGFRKRTQLSRNTSHGEYRVSNLYFSHRKAED
jgi:hypothetical protein